MDKQVYHEASCKTRKVHWVETVFTPKPFIDEPAQQRAADDNAELYVVQAEWVHVNVGAVHLERGDHARAIKAFRQAADRVSLPYLTCMSTGWSLQRLDLPAMTQTGRSSVICEPSR